MRTYPSAPSGRRGQGVVIRLLVLGAHGRVGRRAVAALADDGVHVVPVGRGTGAQEVVEAGDVVLNLATSAADVVGPWAHAGSHAGGYLDVVPTETSHRVVGDLDLGPAPVVPGAGFASTVGDALAVVAARGLVEPDRVDVTVYVPSRRSLLASATPRERADLLAALAHPMDVLVDGAVVPERIAEARRLAWFPRPVGPHHAVATPGTHWRTLPRVLPSVTTVRSALALRSSVAEAVQGVGNLARFGPVERWLRRLGERPGPDPGTEQERWAVVVEVTTTGGGLVRGWAYGHDRHAVTAQAAALLGRRVATADASPEAAAVGPAEVMPAQDLLDALAARGDLRWWVTDPGQAR